MFPEANDYDPENDPNDDHDDVPPIIWTTNLTNMKRPLSPKRVCEIQAGVRREFLDGPVDYDVPVFTGRPAVECAAL